LYKIKQLYHIFKKKKSKLKPSTKANILG